MGLRRSLKETGLVEGQDYTTTYRNAQGDIGTLNSLFDELNGDDTDLVVSISTPALQAALRKVDRKPLVFAGVLDPIAAGAGKSDSDHRPNVTGAYLAFPYAAMARTIREVVPQARRVGTLFTPGEVNSVLARQRFEGPLKGEGLELVSVPVNSPTEVSEAALSLCQSGVDVFCQISDNLSNSSFPAIARACEMAKMPLFTFSPSKVEDGAVLGVGTDFAENGRDAGVLVAEVIRGKDPSRIPFRATTKTLRSVNLDKARRLGVSSLPDGSRRPTRSFPPNPRSHEGWPMDCQIRRADGVAEVVIIGSLDSSWSSYLSERLDEVIRGGALEVRLDMAGVSYLSSNGIALLVRYHNQLRKIGGRFRIVADSEAVSHVLGLTGVLQDSRRRRAVAGARGGRCPDARWSSRQGMTLQVFPRASGAGPGRLELIGDPARLPGRGYDEHDEQTWKAVPGAVAFGLGALGPSFEACRGRFGEFLAVAGVAAYRPSAGPGRPDFEQAAGSFVPQVRLLYGLAFPVERASVVRFEAKGEPGGASVPLEPDRRGLSGPGRERGGGRRARRRDRRAGRRGAEAVARRISPPVSTRSPTPRCATGSRSRPSPSTGGARPWSSGWRLGRRARRCAVSSGRSWGLLRRNSRATSTRPSSLTGRFRAARSSWRRRSRTCSSPAGSRRSFTC